VHSGWNRTSLATYNIDMRGAPVVVGFLAGSLAACRPVHPLEALAARADSVELERASGSCDRGEPGGCDRVALEIARISCEEGAAADCERYDTEVSRCLEHSEGPLCDAMRRHGDLPPEPPPLAEAFGCHVTEGPIGPHAVVCLAEDRVSIRDSAGGWEQWQVTSWGREDTRQHAIRVATLVDGAPLWLTTVEIEGTSVLCGVVVRKSSKRRGRRDAPPPTTCKATAVHVVGLHGLLRATLGAGDAEAEAELELLPTVEGVCASADVCENAIEAARPRPAEDPYAAEQEVPAPSPPGPQTLQHCHARWWSAARAEQAQGRALPAVCEGLPELLGGLPAVDPPITDWDAEYERGRDYWGDELR
jgi:hypothetical protein